MKSYVLINDLCQKLIKVVIFFFISGLGVLIYRFLKDQLLPLNVNETAGKKVKIFNSALIYLSNLIFINLYDIL